MCLCPDPTAWLISNFENGRFSGKPECMKHILIPVFIGFFMASASGLAITTATAQTNPDITRPADPSAASVLQRTKVFDAQSTTLPNGLRIVVIPNHRAPVLTHMVWYRVGAIDEPAGQSGIAHFLEHLMFKGSDHVPPGEFSKRVRAMGGNDNAFTSQDYTAYFQNVAADRLESVMEMEADRMRSLTLPADEVLSERDVVLEERRQNTDSDPRAQMQEQMRHALFAGHPYSIPVIGWPYEIAQLSRENAADFHAKWYAPNNAVVVISGDVTLADIQPIIEKTYGAVAARDVPERISPPMMGFPGEARIVMQSDRIHQPIFQRMIRLPSLRQNKRDALALQVMENILSDGSSSRLYKSLVVDQKIATGAGFSYNPTTWDDAMGGVYAVPADNVAMDKIESAIDTVLAHMATGGVSPAELTAAKTRMRDRAALARDSLQGPAMAFGQTLITGGDIDDVEYWPDEIETVTADDVQRVAQYLIQPTGTHGRGVTGWVLPAPKTDTPVSNDNAQEAAQ